MTASDQNEIQVKLLTHPGTIKENHSSEILNASVECDMLVIMETEMQ